MSIIGRSSSRRRVGGRPVKGVQLPDGRACEHRFRVGRFGEIAVAGLPHSGGTSHGAVARAAGHLAMIGGLTRHFAGHLAVARLRRRQIGGHCGNRRRAPDERECEETGQDEPDHRFKIGERACLSINVGNAVNDRRCRGHRSSRRSREVMQNSAQSFISARRFSKKSVRRYAASTLFGIACARAASATSPR
jgi:hypothetical protein